MVNWSKKRSELPHGERTGYEHTGYADPVCSPSTKHYLD
jgi:hypothetical protein